MGINRQIQQTIDQGRTLFNRAREHPGLQEAFTTHGIDPTVIDEGLTLVDRLEQAYEKHLQEYNRQFAATEALNDRSAKVLAEYMGHLTLARKSFAGNMEAADRLDLGRQRKQARSARLREAVNFYESLEAETELLAQLAPFGLGQETLSRMKEALRSVEEAIQLHATQMQAAQSATITRDDAAEELTQFIRRFRASIAIATRDDAALAEAFDV